MTKNQIPDASQEQQELAEKLSAIPISEQIAHLRIDHRELCDAVKDLVNIMIRVWQVLDMDKRNKDQDEKLKSITKNPTQNG